MPTPRPIISARSGATFDDARDVRREADQRDAGDQAESRRDERHPRGEHRAEGDQQDHERRDHADRRRRPDVEALGLLDHLAAGGDLQARARGST